MKDVWKSTTTVSGEQSATTPLTTLMLQLLARVLAPGESAGFVLRVGTRT